MKINKSLLIKILLIPFCCLMMACENNIQNNSNSNEINNSISDSVADIENDVVNEFISLSKAGINPDDLTDEEILQKVLEKLNELLERVKENNDDGSRDNLIARLENVINQLETNQQAQQELIERIRERLSQLPNIDKDEMCQKLREAIDSGRIPEQHKERAEQNYTDHCS